MNLQFEINKNFNVVEGFWGTALLIDISKLLDNIATNFFEVFNKDLLPKKVVFVRNIKHLATYEPGPEFRLLENTDEIYLDAENRSWAQYTYQFSHELCHHIIGIGFKSDNQFQWFEEALCELASFFCLDKMSITWIKNPPYSIWQSYAESLKQYQIDTISKPEYIITIPFGEWLKQNLDELYLNPYKRTENKIIALHLYDLFKNDPMCWRTIQFFKEIVITNDMKFEHLMSSWEKQIPDDLKQTFAKMKDSLL